LEEREEERKKVGCNLQLAYVQESKNFVKEKSEPCINNEELTATT
jgi:hypothetical protein